MIRPLAITVAAITADVAEWADWFARRIVGDTTADGMVDADNVVDINEQLLHKAMQRHPAGKRISHD